MQFQSVDEILAATAALGRAEGDTFLPSGGPVDGSLIDRLAHTGALGATPEIKGTARWIVRSVAAAQGIRPASIHELYMAMGRGEAGGFTVPAMNIRVMSYYTARAAFRAAKKIDAGAIIFEIARSEIGYTEQRPHEYAAMITAAALREGFTGPLFIQGDHVQVNAKKYHSPDREKEFETLKGLIRDEIGEVGGKNSDIHELHAFMRGYNTQLRNRGEHVGISKISVQTGTAHGGFVGADGKLKMDVQIDLKALEELSSVARSDYGLGGAVQHGASTLPPSAFDAFPKHGACEIHLATDFQNMVYDHPQFPADLKGEMYAWLQEHALEEKKPNDTEQQFLYKARKKAIGPFKAKLWTMDESAKAALGQSLEERFAFLMKQLNVGGTAAAVKQFVKVPQVTFSREAELQAAAGKITATERKAEGLSD